MSYKKKNKKVLLTSLASYTTLTGILLTSTIGISASTTNITDADLPRIPSEKHGQISKVHHNDDEQIRKLYDLLNINDSNWLPEEVRESFNYFNENAPLTIDSASATMEDIYKRTQAIKKLGLFVKRNINHYDTIIEWDGSGAKDHDGRNTSFFDKMDQYWKEFQGYQRQYQEFLANGSGGLNEQAFIQKRTEVTERALKLYCYTLDATNSHPHGQHSNLYTESNEVFNNIAKKHQLIGHISGVMPSSSSFKWYALNNFSFNSHNFNGYYNASNVDESQKLDFVNFQNLGQNKGNDSWTIKLLGNANPLMVVGYLNNIVQANNLNIHDPNIQRILKSIFRVVYSFVSFEKSWTLAHSNGWFNSSNKQEFLRNSSGKSVSELLLIFQGQVLANLRQLGLDIQAALSDAIFKYTLDPSVKGISSIQNIIKVLNRYFNPASTNYDYVWGQALDYENDRLIFMRFMSGYLPSMLKGEYHLSPPDNLGQVKEIALKSVMQGILGHKEPGFYEKDPINNPGNYTRITGSGSTDKNEQIWDAAKLIWRKRNAKQDSDEPTTKEEWIQVYNEYSLILSTNSIRSALGGIDTNNGQSIKDNDNLNNVYIDNVTELKPNTDYSFGKTLNALFFANKIITNNNINIDTKYDENGNQKYRHYIESFNSLKTQYDSADKTKKIELLIPKGPILSRSHFNTYDEYKEAYTKYLEFFDTEFVKEFGHLGTLPTPVKPIISGAFENERNSKTYTELFENYLTKVKAIVDLNRNLRNKALQQIVEIPLLGDQNLDRVEVHFKDGQVSYGLSQTWPIKKGTRKPEYFPDVEAIYVGEERIKIDKNSKNIIWVDPANKYKGILRIMPGTNTSQLDVDNPTSIISLRNSLIRHLDKSAKRDYNIYVKALIEYFDAHKDGLTTDEISQLSKDITDEFSLKNPDGLIDVDGYTVTDQTGEYKTVDKKATVWDGINMNHNNSSNGKTNSTRLEIDKSLIKKIEDKKALIKSKYDANQARVKALRDATIALIKASKFDSSDDQYAAKKSALEEQINQSKAIFPKLVKNSEDALKTAEVIYKYTKYLDQRYQSGGNNVPKASFGDFAIRIVSVDNAEYRTMLNGLMMIIEKERFEKVKFGYDGAPKSITLSEWTKAKKWFDDFYNENDEDTKLFVNDKNDLTSKIEIVYAILKDTNKQSQSVDRFNIDESLFTDDINKVIPDAWFETAREYNSAALAAEKLEIQNANLEALKATKKAVEHSYVVYDKDGQYFTNYNGALALNTSDELYKLVKSAKDLIKNIDPNKENGKYAIIKADYEGYNAALAAMAELIHIQKEINSKEYKAFNKTVWENYDKKLVLWSNRIDYGWLKDLTEDGSLSGNNAKDKTEVALTQIQDSNPFKGVNNSSIRNILLSKIFFLQYLNNYQYVKSNYIPDLDFKNDNTIKVNDDVKTKGITTIGSNNAKAQGKISVALRADTALNQSNLIDSLKKMYKVLAKPKAKNNGSTTTGEAFNSFAEDERGQLIDFNSIRSYISSINGKTDDYEYVKNPTQAQKSQLRTLYESVKDTKPSNAGGIKAAAYFVKILEKVEWMLAIDDAKKELDNNTALSGNGKQEKEKHYHLNAYTQAELNEAYEWLLTASQLWTTAKNIHAYYEKNKENVSGKNVESYWKNKISTPVYDEYIKQRQNAKDAYGDSSDAYYFEADPSSKNLIKKSYKDLDNAQVTDENKIKEAHTLAKKTLASLAGNSATILPGLLSLNEQLQALEKAVPKDDAKINKTKQEIEALKSKLQLGILELFTNAVNAISDSPVDPAKLKELIAELNGQLSYNSSDTSDTSWKTKQTNNNTVDVVYGIEPQQFILAKTEKPNNSNSGGYAIFNNNYRTAPTDAERKLLGDLRDDIDYNTIFANHKYTQNFDHYADHPTSILTTNSGADKQTKQIDMDIMTKLLESRMIAHVYKSIYWAYEDYLIITKTAEYASELDQNGKKKYSIKQAFEETKKFLENEANGFKAGALSYNEVDGKIPLPNLSTKMDQYSEEYFKLVYKYLNSPRADRESFRTIGSSLENAIKLNAVSDKNSRLAYIKFYKNYIDARDKLTAEVSTISGEAFKHQDSSQTGSAQQNYKQLFEAYQDVIKYLKYGAANAANQAIESGDEQKFLDILNRGKKETDKQLSEVLTYSILVLKDFLDNQTIETLDKSNDAEKLKANKENNHYYSQEELKELAIKLYKAKQAKVEADNKEKVDTAKYIYDFATKLKEELTLSVNERLSDKIEKIQDHAKALKVQLDIIAEFTDANDQNKYDENAKKVYDAYLELYKVAQAVIEYSLILVKIQKEDVYSLENLQTQIKNLKLTNVKTDSIKSWTNVIDKLYEAVSTAKNAQAYKEYAASDYAKAKADMPDPSRSQGSSSFSNDYGKLYEETDKALIEFLSKIVDTESEQTKANITDLASIKDKLDDMSQKILDVNSKGNNIVDLANEKFKEVVEAIDKFAANKDFTFSGKMKISETAYDRLTKQLNRYLLLLAAQFKVNNLIFDDNINDSFVEFDTLQSSQSDELAISKAIIKQIEAWGKIAEVHSSSSNNSQIELLRLIYQNTLRNLINNSTEDKKARITTIEKWMNATNHLETLVIGSENNYNNINNETLLTLQQQNTKVESQFNALLQLLIYIRAKFANSEYKVEKENGDLEDKVGFNPIFAFNKDKQVARDLDQLFAKMGNNKASLSNVDSLIISSTLEKLIGFNGRYAQFELDNDNYYQTYEDREKITGAYSYFLKHINRPNTNRIKDLITNEIGDLTGANNQLLTVLDKADNKEIFGADSIMSLTLVSYLKDLNTLNEIHVWQTELILAAWDYLATGSQDSLDKFNTLIAKEDDIKTKNKAFTELFNNEVKEKDYEKQFADTTLVYLHNLPKILRL
ncbi:hypothetical protein [Mycoplasmopsis opalescens]|uniref:hypothetical protein n=1 Tax=Mycoplasmopsis opalescens TaxID=114886 RepID=UPI0004A76E2B|nr:hypothetical protein [Mycoplasmopsis opalescens]